LGPCQSEDMSQEIPERQRVTAHSAVSALTGRDEVPEVPRLGDPLDDLDAPAMVRLAWYQ
jgi:hypothetical protein